MVTDNTRRKLLKVALFGACAPILPFGCASQSGEGRKRQPALVGCALTSRNQFSAVIADNQGQALNQLPLPGRGHGVAIHPTDSHAVAFGRRPGAFMMVFDYRRGEMLHLLPSGDKRHFYGHGVYSNDGKWLYATEGERGTSRGIIGVYDVEHGYNKVDEFSGFGIGPHEVIIMPDDTLAIGVGGVHTNGRTPLNIQSMQPSLTYLSPQGLVMEQVSLADHQLSIRHLANDGSDTVLCGQQYRGEPTDSPSLLAMHTRGGEMLPMLAEPEQWARFNHYIASIAATSDWILATSPRGNCYGIWSKKTRKLVELSALPDASGVVVQGDAFQVSSGASKVVTSHYPDRSEINVSNVQWDNHWSAII